MQQLKFSIRFLQLKNERKKEAAVQEFNWTRFIAKTKVTKTQNNSTRYKYQKMIELTKYTETVHIIDYYT